MQHEFWTLRQRVQLRDSLSKSSCHIRVGGFVEADMGVADLREGEIALHSRLVELVPMAERERFQNSSLHYAERPCSSPRHALQEAAAVNSVGVQIVLDDISHRIPRSRYGWPVLRGHVSLH